MVPLMDSFSLPFLKKQVSYIPQMETTECGAASLTMILAYHGHHASLPEVRVACGVSRDGANALSIVRAAEEYGLEAKGVKIEMDQLEDIELPAILHWDFNHFLVLERLGRKRVILVDPACGRMPMSLEEMSRHFTGVALLFEPGEHFRKKPKSYPSLARYASVFRTSLPSLLQILLASLALQMVGLVFPVANQILLDRVIIPAQHAWLWGLAFGLGAATLARTLLSLVRSYVVQGLQNVLDFTLMGRFTDHMLHLSLSFFLQREAGDLVQRVQSNASIRNLLSSQSIAAVLDGLLLTGYASLMLAYNAKLGMVVLGFALARVMLLLALRKKNQQIMASELASQGREFGALVEAMSGLETTKASGAESRMVIRWAHRMTRRVNQRLERRRLAIGADQVMTVLQGGAMAAVFFIGGQEVLAQRMTLGVFASFMAMQNLFMLPLETLLESVEQLQFLGNHLKRLDDVLETEPEQSGTQDPGRLKGAITLENVSFSYTPGAPPILQDISLSIKPGEKIAIVGPSGAGKSTLARLLLGMHVPSKGVIAFDGLNLCTLNLQKLRNQMGVVLQETFLFDDTVRTNLALNNDAIPMERLQWVAHMACVDQVIEKLPLGYLSRVGENGCLLSGGERQRLNLARALSHDPAILLLDEATSSLDPDTESLLHANLASLGCTRIIIAHRMATVRDADRIFVLEAGRIVQCGHFSELSVKEGLFRDIFEASVRQTSLRNQERNHG